MSRSPRASKGTPKHFFRPRPHRGLPARRPSGESGSYRTPKASLLSHSPENNCAMLQQSTVQNLSIVSAPKRLLIHTPKRPYMYRNVAIELPNTKQEHHENSSMVFPQAFPTPTQGTPSMCILYGTASSHQLSRSFIGWSTRSGWPSILLQNMLIDSSVGTMRVFHWLGYM